jgi:hypothetical protein
VPFPSQFLHACFFSPIFFHTERSKIRYTMFQMLRAESYHHPNDRSVTGRTSFSSVPIPNSRIAIVT